MTKTALPVLSFGFGAGVLTKNNDYKHLVQRGMRDEKGLHLYE
jgi:phospholipid N-methyltransferase